MPLRLVPSLLAVAAVALSTAGLGSFAFDVVLVAVVVGAAAGLEAVASVVDGERSRTSAALVGLALLSLVAAGATRRPELALGCLVCYGIDRFRFRMSGAVVGESKAHAAESATRKRAALSAD